MRRFIFIVFLSVLPAITRAEEPAWIVQPYLHYQLKYTDETKASLPRIKTVLSDFDAFFKTKCPNMTKSVEESKITICFYPSDSSTVGTGYACLDGGPSRRQGLDVYDGTITIAGPVAFTGKDDSSSGHPKDHNYFDKLLINEVSPVYLTLYCKVNGSEFNGYPNWFVQGVEEYLGVRHSTPYWKAKGVRTYYDRLSNNPDSIDTSFGLFVEDDYNDGFLLFDFIAKQYGEEKIFEILSSRENTLGRKLKSVLKIDFEVFRTQLAKWKNTETTPNKPDAGDGK